MATVTGAARIWARHSVLPCPDDLRDDAEFVDLCDGLARVADTYRNDQRLSFPDQQWLRQIRPALHRRLLTMPPSGERGYVESALSVVDAFLTEARLGTPRSLDRSDPRPRGDPAPTVRHRFSRQPHPDH
jgi:hypothetical protein